ncbi:uncharacterized protein BT62DRAFT_209262 [Guyanagaster necrorhizus]|uniref:Uncharacterized protein n=1 Tax=Guyanagaster necrorhizus TaxID=856835 RepID=A0A9P8ARN4_9AGAR|nr:uncharacterized protein BT62DRAFT_209262 [Guyanagaster necrorhizus MCA 3950]KAG7445086.1 hypothetical protein BT62DRAFT_209262 [Guyanagaster necrorhizus MCA 3950]
MPRGVQGVASRYPIIHWKGTYTPSHVNSDRTCSPLSSTSTLITRQSGRRNNSEDNWYYYRCGVNVCPTKYVRKICNWVSKTRWPCAALVLVTLSTYYCSCVVLNYSWIEADCIYFP